MNEIVAGAHAEALRRLAASGPRIEVAYLDACDVREGRYAVTVGRRLGDLSCTVVANHHADDLLTVVAAASIVAKVHRDRAIRALSEAHGPLGSGYPSDPVTCRFLDECLEAGGSLPPFVRASWRTVTDRQHARETYLC
jgi:ribonuclease HII